MNEIERLQRIEWIKSKLKVLSLVDPGVVCSGGACRDLYFRREPADYDLFIQVPSLHTRESLAQLCTLLLPPDNGGVFRDLGNEEYELLQNRADALIVGVCEAQVDGRTIQVIGYRDEASHQTSRHPFSFNRMVLSAESADIFVPMSTARDIRGRRIYIGRVTEAPSRAYLEKVMNKYPEFSFFWQDENGDEVTERTRVLQGDADEEVPF